MFEFGSYSIERQLSYPFRQRRFGQQSKAKPPKTLGGLQWSYWPDLRSRHVISAVRAAAESKAPRGFRGACNGATGRTCKEQTCLRRNSDRSPPARSRHVISAIRTAAKSKAPRGFRGACDGATGRTCKEQTCLRRNSDRSPPARSRHVISAAIASRYFGRPGSSRKQSPSGVPRGLQWSYWPDLNRRPADYESAALPTEPQ